jgi:DNA-binding beta-propeller fold protein YncE
MKGRSASGLASISSRSAKNDRGSSHGLTNPAWLLAAVFVACHWASAPCYGQIDVNAYISNFNSVGSPIAMGSDRVGAAVTPNSKFAYVANSFSHNERAALG